jgi:hypothetical protein
MRSASRAACCAAMLLLAVGLPTQPASSGSTLPGGGRMGALALAGADGLPLGPDDLSEQRTTTAVAPGVTLTRIVRGEGEPPVAWTVELAIPPGSGSPDPDAPPTALRDRQSAEDLAAALAADGFDARAEEVITPAMADFGGGTLGWRVRVGSFDSEAAAVAERTRLQAAGYAGSATYTGWDGEPGVHGPWRVDVLTIDPRKFTGRLVGSYGPDLENRERTSELAAAEAATAAVNAGFFVLDPRAGAPGDPAGVGVYDGSLLSEPVDGRPSLVIGGDARRTDVVRLSWNAGVITQDGTRLTLDGINRVPGLIRNCGGTGGDVPTMLPLHDFTCTDSNELVAFTDAYGGTTPTGAGVEAVLDAKGTVVEVRSPRGGTLPPGGRSIQATGDLTDDLADVARIGERLQVRAALVKPDGSRLGTSPFSSVVNGGPELVRNGQVHATPATDGMVHPGDPSFYYGWVHKRHPRTIAGVDAGGRTVLITADGRSTDALGLSIAEAADVAAALGLRDAVNLDGGGSTTMVVGDQVINDPSDAAGERPVGDALLLLPSH